MITPERLRELIHYDPETGTFRWAMMRKGCRVGDIVGSIDSHGYRVIRLNWKIYNAHRLAWLYMTGVWPRNQIDHKDLNKSNNKWNNLREATYSQNQANRRPYSGLKGVSFFKRDRKWKAQIKVRGNAMHIGYYDCPAAAHFAYLIEADKHFGEFARAS